MSENQIVDSSLFLARQGIPFDQSRPWHRPASIAHKQSEKPLFPASVELAALKRRLAIKMNS